MSNSQSPIPNLSTLRSDQIGTEEIRRRVDAAIVEVETGVLLTDPPAEDKRPSVRDLARSVRPLLDKDVLEAIQREGLIRVVRRVRRLNRNKPNRRKAGGRRPEEKILQPPAYSLQSADP